MTRPETVVTILMVGALIAFLPQAASRPAGRDRKAVCAENLRMIGLGMQLYATDNAGWLPHHYYEPAGDSKNPASHGVSWIGAMGSHADLKISQDTSASLSPQRGHPSRSLFKLIIAGDAVPEKFVCPLSHDVEDDLRNYGPDEPPPATKPSSQPAGFLPAWVTGRAEARGIAAIPGRTRFDFLGYDRLSYGYQLPFGPSGRPHQELPAALPLSADKGPFFVMGGDVLKGSNTSSDQPSAIRFPRDWTTLPREKVEQLAPEEWLQFNSRNHDGEDQNVLFRDGHVKRQATPLAGIQRDNIYTRNAQPLERLGGILGEMPTDGPMSGPTTNSDSYIVP